MVQAERAFLRFAGAEVFFVAAFFAAALVAAVFFAGRFFAGAFSSARAARPASNGARY